jgi:hypothetical protein
LILYARQLAWFNTKPRHPEKAGVANGPTKQAELSRAQEITERGGTPLMPDVEGSEYLVAHWQDLGVITSGGMGLAALSSQEIWAWDQCHGTMLQPWELRVLRDMSRSYLVQLHESEKPDCLPPFGDPVNVFDRGLVAKKVSNAFRSFQQVNQK